MATPAADNQHLDFLISQYVDGSLDAAGRKYIETQIANDPGSRQLLKDHRDVQDLLDDYASRLPMIDWNGFDAQLAVRLEKTQSQSKSNSHWRWIKPAAIAASVMLAAVLGYQWHGGRTAPRNGDGRGAMASLGGGPAIRVRLDRPHFSGASESIAKVAERIPAAQTVTFGHLPGQTSTARVVARADGGPHSGHSAGGTVGIVRLFGPATTPVSSGGPSVADRRSSDHSDPLGINARFGPHQAGPGSVSAMAPEPSLLPGQSGNSWPVH